MSIKQIAIAAVLAGVCMAASWPTRAGVMLDKSDCYSACTMVGGTSLSCGSSTCIGYGGYHLGEDAGGFFKRSLYHGACKYYDGAAWLPCVQKRYYSWWDDVLLTTVYSWQELPATFAARDRAILEPIYLLLLGAVPTGAGFEDAPPDPLPLPSAVDYSAWVSCYDVTVNKLYYSYSQGAVNAYPVLLTCNDTTTPWTGEQLFYLPPDMGRGGLATLMQARINTDPTKKLMVSMTSYSAGSFLESIIVGDSCTDGCAVPVDCGDGVTINCDACTGAVCP